MNLKKASRGKERNIIIDDIIMMVLLLINLSIIIFDWFFMSEAVREFLMKHAFSFYTFYNENVHENFVAIDLFFVGIFLMELLIRWAIAIKRNTYHRWFFYPFVHWYDTLGCIPVSSFRFFRILRVISIGYRLQRLDIVDMRQTYIYKMFIRYYNILMEEVSDRVIINILDRVGDQVKAGGPVATQIVEQVILPKKDLLIEWMVQRIRKTSARTYYLYQDDLKRYLNQLMKEVMENNKEIKTISQIPVFGVFITSTLEQSINNIIYTTLDVAIKDLSAEENHPMIHGIASHLFSGLSTEDGSHDLTATAQEALLESLELIKEQVKIKQWKLREDVMNK